MMPSSYTTICILIGLHTFPDALYACPGTLYLFFNIYMRFQTLYMCFQTLSVRFPDTLWAKAHGPRPMGQAHGPGPGPDGSCGNLKKNTPWIWGMRICPNKQ